MITAQLIDVGRNKVNQTIKAKSTSDLHKKIGKHILSRDWDMVLTSAAPDTYKLFAGFRPIGSVKILEEKD